MAKLQKQTEQPLSGSPLRSGESDTAEGFLGALLEDEEVGVQPINRHATAETQEPEKVLGVSDFLDYINIILKTTQGVKVIGEISELKMHPSGIYLCLKDKNGDGVMDAYINPYAYRGMGLPLEVGMKVKVSGYPSIYKPKGRFSFRIESVELEGEGSLKKAYDLLKIKLEAEGLFAEERKRPIPPFISRIGIITSKTGAVIDDFRKNLAPLGLHLSLKDVRVEGATAVESIANALEYFGKAKVDCIVLMRGGGSLEDLQAFNNERIVRAIFQSPTPIIAAIGHDRDIPLSCLVADTFTSTPTAAATQVINKSWESLTLQLPLLSDSLLREFESLLDTSYNRTSRAAHILSAKYTYLFSRFTHAASIIRTKTKWYREWIKEEYGKLSVTQSRIEKLFIQTMQRYHEQLRASEQIIAGHSPERNLRLGYAIVRNTEGKVVKSVHDVRVGDTLSTQVQGGNINSKVLDKE